MVVLSVVVDRGGAAAVFVFFLGYYGIKVSTRVGTILGVFEIAVFAALALWMIIDAGGDNTLAVFGTRYATVPGFEGISGVIAGSVYTILAFIGFEAAAPLAEEARILDGRSAGPSSCHASGSACSTS